MKPKPGDISIVVKTGTFLLWYDNVGVVSLPPCEPSGILFNLGIKAVSFCAVPIETGARHRRF